MSQENEINRKVNEEIAQRRVNYDKLSDIKAAFIKFALENKIPVSLGIEFHIGRQGYIQMKNPLDSSQLGVFATCLKEAYMTFFNSSRIEFEDRYMWFTLHIHYQVINGGENGVEYPVQENSTLYYDQKEKKFLTSKQVLKKVKAQEK
jgi:hypothetical protein